MKKYLLNLMLEIFYWLGDCAKSLWYGFTIVINLELIGFFIGILFLIFILLIILALICSPFI